MGTGVGVGGGRALRTGNGLGVGFGVERENHPASARAASAQSASERRSAGFMSEVIDWSIKRCKRDGESRHNLGATLNLPILTASVATARTCFVHPRAACFPVFLLVLSSTTLLSRESASVDARAAVVSAPMPNYPYAARSKYLQGQGKFLIRFDANTGHAKEVEIVRSTGYAVLDEAAIGALRRWVVKAHSFDVIEVPINFELSGLKATTAREAAERAGKGNILYSPWPRFPLAASAHGVAGKGRFQLGIDPRTGLVTEVQILETTHDTRLDEAAVKALRQWRFKPNTLRKFVVPIDFDLGYG